MAGRRLGADERALWARVTASVRAFAPRAAEPQTGPAPPVIPEFPTRMRAAAPPPPAPLRAATPGETLDGGWDRRLRRGLVPPDFTIDLHGHTLASAHSALDHSLDRAIADGARLLLLVTGRAPAGKDRDAAGPRRGVIRASIGDWLGSSRHAARIAAVRNAHPRHGGAGALYVVLRRRREG